MKVIILFVLALICVPAYSESENIRKVEVKSRTLEKNVDKADKFNQSVEMVPTSIYETSVTVNYQGILKHSCNKMHNHTIDLIDSDIK